MAIETPKPWFYDHEKLMSLSAEREKERKERNMQALTQKTKQRRSRK